MKLRFIFLLGILFFVFGESVSQTKKNDTLAIIYADVGHRYSNRKKIEIKQNDTTYECSLFCENLICTGSDTMRWLTDTIKYMLCKNVWLFESDIKELNSFKREFDNLPSTINFCGFFHRYGLYTLKTSDLEITKTDCDNKWNGFHLLQDKIFGLLE
ncbi:hypothetical protein ACQ33O_00705 [Ferruginibacter sp. SUN002]|uniref:hypothetical protein n=1 Tax=Ferruginibacter sp. SUN002 TaxID=2937789 RepID=UPI003D363C19